MDRIHLIGLFLNFIIYFFMLIPVFFILFNKPIYENKKKFLSFLCISTLIEIFLSCIIYFFPKSISSIFTKTNGIINYAAYSSRILFISSSLYGIKFLVPYYIWKVKNKKTAILVLSKIAVNILFIFIGYILFNTKGILYSFPICDLIYCIIYLKIFLNVIR